MQPSPFTKGSHGSTFGGNHLVCKVARAVVEKTSERKFLDEVNQKGNYLRKKLQRILSSRATVRGLGLMVGVAFTDVDAKDFINKAMEAGLLLIPSAHNSIRVYPPLTVSIEEIDKAIENFIPKREEAIAKEFATLLPSPTKATFISFSLPNTS